MAAARASSASSAWARLLGKRTLQQAVDELEDAPSACWKLRRVVKENRRTGASGRVAAPRGDKCNLLASVGGGPILSVFDNENFGQHLDLVSLYVHEAQDKASSSELSACAWLEEADEDARVLAGAWEPPSACAPQRDLLRTRPLYSRCALLAGVHDGSVLVVSLARSRVVARLTGHATPVDDIAVDPTRPGRFASCSSAEGDVRLWDCREGR
jgi:WD40 repeat protein